MRARIGLCCLWTIVAAGSLVEVTAQAGLPRSPLACRHSRIVTRCALLVAYATTLDNRDFSGFEQLGRRTPSSSAGRATREGTCGDPRPMRTRIGLYCLCAIVASGSLVKVSAQAGSPAALAARVQTLEDRDAIRALLVAYATTLDNRDFSGFEQLWAKDAEFFGGAGNTAKGPAAIRDLLRGLLGKNGASYLAAISIS